MKIIVTHEDYDKVTIEIKEINLTATFYSYEEACKFIQQVIKNITSF